MATRKLLPATMAMALVPAALLALAPSVQAAPLAYYTNSTSTTPLDMGDANGWEGVNNTAKSVIFEAYIDYSQAAADAENALGVWEAGADGVGSGVAIVGSTIYFAVGDARSVNGSTVNFAVASGSHGLSAGDTDIQILALWEKDGGTAGNELLELYVNGTLIQSVDSTTLQDWAGADKAGLGGTIGTSIFKEILGGNPGAYPSAGSEDLQFAVYLLGGDNTVASILVPEPGSLALLGLGGLCVLRRRRNA